MLKGRPIGLKANMTKEEMKNHLLSKLQEWQKEGLSEIEVKNAIYSKCKPLGLTSNFYWSRYPESAERLRQAWDELNWGIKETYNDSMAKLRMALKEKAKSKRKIEQKTEKIETKDYISQF